MKLSSLSERHVSQLRRAAAMAQAQWAPEATAPMDVVAAMDRVVLFLKQNGDASAQSRQVASLAFVVGEQIVQLADWKWMNASDDDTLNPAIVSADGHRAVALLDIATLLVMGETSGSLTALARACVGATNHEWMTLL